MAPKAEGALKAEVTYMQIGDFKWAFLLFFPSVEVKDKFEKDLHKELEDQQCITYSGQGETLLDQYGAYGIDLPTENNVIAILSDTGFDHVWRVIRTLLLQFFGDSKITNASNVACKFLKNPFKYGTPHFAKFSTYDYDKYDPYFSIKYVHRVRETTNKRKRDEEV